MKVTQHYPTSISRTVWPSVREIVDFRAEGWFEMGRERELDTRTDAITVVGIRRGFERI